MTSRSVLGQAVCSGIKRAFDAYSKMSDGWEWPHDRGIEGFISGYVGLSIHRDTGLSISLETPIWELESETRVARPGPVKSALRASGRCDVVAWNGPRPFAAIEVKRTFNRSEIQKDVRRLEALADRMKSARRPLSMVGVAFPDARYHRKAAERIETRRAEIEDWSCDAFSGFRSHRFESLMIDKRVRGAEEDRYFGEAWCCLARV